MVVNYNEQNPEHHIRRGRVMTRPSGEKYIPEAFEVVLAKVRTQGSSMLLLFMLSNQGSRMRENEKAEINLYTESPDEQRLDKIACDVVCYRGKSKDPHWIDLEPGNLKPQGRIRHFSAHPILLEMFSSLCTVYANTSAVTKVKQRGVNGSVYYTQRFKLVLLCGLTETKAQLSWIQDVRTLHQSVVLNIHEDITPGRRETVRLSAYCVAIS